MPIIDAHHHFWQLSLPAPFDYGWLKKPEHAAIGRDFLPEDLKPQLDKVGVTHTVFVQTQHHPDENRWVLRLADENPWIVGVVGWVDLQSPAVAEQIATCKQHPKFVGVRHITQDEPDDDFIIRPAVLRGLKALEKARLPFDLLFFVKHLKHAATVAQAVPELPLVVDHLAKPKIKTQSIDDWLPHFKAAAACPNVVCKLSGMVTEADWKNWKPADLQPYVDHALELFGPERLMYGSDWPVCELAGSYERVFRALEECLAKLSADERDAIYCRTAQKFYGLKL
jgi:L-fuconolactonase